MHGHRANECAHFRVDRAGTGDGRRQWPKRRAFSVSLIRLGSQPGAVGAAPFEKGDSECHR